jgi:hypothetical protein
MEHAGIKGNATKEKKKRVVENCFQLLVFITIVFLYWKGRNQLRVFGFWFLCWKKTNKTKIPRENNPPPLLFLFLS